MSQWTLGKVLQFNKTTQPVFNDEKRWAEVWTRPVSEFGFELVKFKDIAKEEDFRDFDWETLQPTWIPVSQIKSSLQGEGVRLDVLDWYIRNGDSELYDLDGGLLGNMLPVVIARPDGTYTMMDGTHRIITRMLRGEKTVQAYMKAGIA